jgi:CubicO group peptidase (beta-lactamase class C family)
MTYRLLMPLAGCAFLAAAPAAQPTGSVGANQTTAVGAMFARWDKPDSPGCSVGVIKDGVLVHASGYGRANLEHGIAITAKTVFDIGSCSKQFTAFSILILAQEQKLSLQDNIRKFLPEIPDYGRPILIRHLLHHTSGLRDYNDLLELDDKRVEDVTTDEDALRLIAKQRALNFPPGERHLYSNTGYFLLAVIVKRASGESLRVFAHKNIFQPLGMENTHFHDDHTLIVKSRATGYSPRPEGGFSIDMSNWEQLGDGALMTTIEDLLKWDQNFYDAKVGGRMVLDQMLTPGELNDGRKLKYACGLIVGEYRGRQMIHHGGAWAGYRAQMVRFPKQKLSVFVLGNLSTLDTWNLAGKVGLLFLEGEANSETPKNTETDPPKPLSLPARELTRFVGAYTNFDGRVRHVHATNGHLVLVARGGTRELTALGEGRFAIRGVPGTSEVKFAQPPGRSRQMIITQDDEQPVTWNAAPPGTGQLKLADYSGIYGSEELNGRYVLSVFDEKLMMTRGTISDPLTPEFADGFSLKTGTTVKFRRDKRKQVIGFTLSTGRANGLLFERTALE